MSYEVKKTSMADWLPKETVESVKIVSAGNNTIELVECSEVFQVLYEETQIAVDKSGQVTVHLK